MEAELELEMEGFRVDRILSHRLGLSVIVDRMDGKQRPSRASESHERSSLCRQVRSCSRAFPSKDKGRDTWYEPLRYLAGAEYSNVEGDLVDRTRSVCRVDATS